MNVKTLPSVRRFLLAFGAAIVMPVLGFAGVLLWNYAQSERAQYDARAGVTANNLIAAVDLELSKLQVAVEALATSPSILARDYKAFQDQALDALRLWSPDDPNKLAVVLRDLTGQQLANTRVPWGQPLPKGANPTVDEDIVKSRRPVIQGLFVGATARRPIASIRVPVFTTGEVSHVLSIAIEPDRFLDLIKAQKLPVNWIATIVDGNDRVVSRSREHERFLGQLAPEEFRRTETGNHGVWTGKTLDDAPVTGAYERSPLSGWRAFVGVPEATAQGPLRRSLWLIAALGVFALALSYLLAVPFGRRITRSAQALASAAAHLGRGEPVLPVASGLREMDEVGRALASASMELRARESALTESEGRLRATHENAAVGIVEVDRDGRLLYVNEARCRMSGFSRSELLGKTIADLAPPGEPDEDTRLFEQQVAGEFNVYTLEKRYVRADGSMGWARMSSSAVRDQSGALAYAVRIIEDITERKEAEFRQSLLVDELNHRVKNTLATVQSLAFQSFRGGASAEAARERFEARLLSLSRTHNLLNESSWTGASLREVLTREVEPYAGDRSDRVSVSGPDLDLTAPAAVAGGMVFHELATNAVKYGSLSNSDGRVEISWVVTPDELLRLRWSERNGPPVVAPARRGFGSRLVEQTVTQQLNGWVRFRFEPEGFECELEISLQAYADGLAAVARFRQS